MGITVLTLALASQRKEEIPDHRNGTMAKVISTVGENGTEFYLQYPNGRQRKILWKEHQGVPGRLIRRGREIKTK